MDENQHEGRHVELAELHRPEQGGTYRKASSALRHPRSVAIDRIGSSILLALILVGVLAVASGESIGEQGLGVAMICVAGLLLIKEILYSIHAKDAPEEPPARPSPGESDD